jgi:hypothetical protein
MVLKYIGYEKCEEVEIRDKMINYNLIHIFFIKLRYKNFVTIRIFLS